MAESPKAPGKRKRETQQLVSSKHTPKRMKKAKVKPAQTRESERTADVNDAIAHMDSKLLSDHVAQGIRRFEPKLSLVELEDRFIPERAIRDTSEWSQSRTTEQLPSYLEYFHGGPQASDQLSKAGLAPGCPHTLVIAAAGLRAADLARTLRKFQTKEAMVAKLFAKHIKLKEAVGMAKKSRIGIGVGTPQRIVDLLENGALSSEALERIVIDASHINQKKRGILDMQETEIPLTKLLARDELRSRFDSDDKRIDLLFF
ncbi:MAG: hypothetical protein M1820_006674 [Bogoriella megaspora]|nr:MAG: hypothetical protein M1820_006674 [Bogoriella megaspora]